MKKPLPAGQWTIFNASHEGKSTHSAKGEKPDWEEGRLIPKGVF